MPLLWYEFEKAFHPLYVISKLFGLTPFYLKGTDGNYPFVSLLYSCLILSINSGLLYGSYNIENFQKKTNSDILLYASQVQVTSGLILCALNVVLSFFQGKELRKLLDRLHTVDRNLRSVGVDIDYRFVRRIVLLGISCFTISLFLIVLGGWLVYTVSLKSDLSWVTYCSYFIVNASFFIVLLQFLTTAKVVQLCFRKINQILTEFAKTKKQHMERKTWHEPRNRISFTHGVDNDSSDFSVSNSVSVVNVLCKTHDVLCDMVESINMLNSVQIMLGIGWRFIYVLIGLFSLYRMFVGQDAIMFWYVVNMIYMCCYYAILIIYTISICSSTTRTGMLTASLVHKLINETWDELLVKKLQGFSMQLTHCRPVFSCGLFPFDWTLLYSMLGAGTTYLVILVQLNMEDVDSTKSGGMNQTFSGAGFY